MFSILTLRLDAFTSKVKLTAITSSKYDTNLFQSSTNADMNNNDKSNDHLYELRQGQHLIEKDDKLFQEMERHHEDWSKPVQVHEMTVDPITVTLIFFAAIAINFVVFAQTGDLGLTNMIARMINA